jgi:putative DNA primase/helicase
MKISYDDKIDIATGKHRREQSWKNKQILWSELLKKLSTTHRTAETHAEYLTSKKSRQDEIKDIGGFVGGYLNNGKRNNGSVVHRQLATMDIDFAKLDTWDDFQLIYANAACIYSTHKHEPNNPRLRLIMPLDREVMADEYVAICRRIAGNIGIQDFDPTGFRPAQLMYWPSTPKDGEYIFEYQDGPWINADEILATYHNWKDASEWPISEKEKAIPQRAIKRQDDPLEKTGIVGAFCRTYNIHEAIEKFLTDAYEACGIEDRYTYLQGSTAGGLVVYEDKYAFSHHGSDPVSGKLCNAFDLVRLHKYGLKDEDLNNEKASFEAMIEFATKDPEVRKRTINEKISEAQYDFQEDMPEDKNIDDSWKEQMTCGKNGNLFSTANNVLLILKNDPKLKDKYAYDSFEHREIAKSDLPWRKVTHATRYLTDRDDSALRHYIETFYGISGERKIADAMNLLMMENSFHPIKDYLESQQWDGEKRVDGLFIDYLGAKDNEYTRAVARKWTVGAVSRIFEPGCKFDYMPILIGEQGEKKSMLPDKLGGQWFSDSFTTVQRKEAFEQLQGAWLLEVAELSAMKNAETESVKHFISKRKDHYRVAYGRRVETFPRQSVLIGTSNKKNPLKDPTGGRRFWPVATYENQPTKDVHKNLNDYEVGQIWAEAFLFYKQSEPLYLSAELEKYASRVQADHSEQDERYGMILQYLDTLLPADWDNRDIYQRREWLTAKDDIDGVEPLGTKRRDRVCVSEIWCEVLGGQKKDLIKRESMPLHDIMRNMQGWKLKNSDSGKSTFKIYGTQRCYERIRPLRPSSAVKAKNQINTTMPIMPNSSEVNADKKSSFG